MSRYIDAEWLKEHTEFISYTGMWHETETGEFVSRETMEEAPSIDIVRCSECEHHEDFPTGISPLTCSLVWGGVFENDFCSYGQVSEKPTSSEKPNNSERSSE